MSDRSVYTLGMENSSAMARPVSSLREQMA